MVFGRHGLTAVLETPASSVCALAIPVLGSVQGVFSGDYAARVGASRVSEMDEEAVFFGAGPIGLGCGVLAQGDEVDDELDDFDEEDFDDDFDDDFEEEADDEYEAENEEYPDDDFGEGNEEDLGDVDIDEEIVPGDISGEEVEPAEAEEEDEDVPP